jgi:hypothetical protein
MVTLENKTTPSTLFTVFMYKSVTSRRYVIITAAVACPRKTDLSAALKNLSPCRTHSTFKFFKQRLLQAER